MSLSRIKTWAAGEVLSASDLNAEFNNILNNPSSLVFPVSGNITWQSGTVSTGTLDHAITGDRTWTFPDFNGTLATLAGTETFTNKTHSTGTTFTAAFVISDTAGSAGSSAAGSYTFSGGTNLTAGGNIVLYGQSHLTKASTLELKSGSTVVGTVNSEGLSLGGYAPRGTTSPTNALSLFDGTAPVGTLANGVTFYSASGEARVMDAAGNSSLLSPHDRRTNEWIFDSVDTVTGRHLRIDMERLCKAVNEYLGLDCVHDSAD